MARSLKLPFYEVEGLYYLCVAKTKMLIAARLPPMLGCGSICVVAQADLHIYMYKAGVVMFK